MRTVRHLVFLVAAGICLPPTGLDAQDGVSAHPHTRLTAAQSSAIAFSRDGRHLAVGDRRGTIRLFDVEAGRQVREFTTAAGMIGSLAFAAGDARLVAAGGNRQLVAVDLVSSVVTARRVGSRVVSVDTDPGGSGVVSGGADGWVEVFTAELAPVRRLQAPELFRRNVHWVGFGRNGEEVFAAAASGTTVFWNRHRDEPIRTGSMTRREVTAAARDQTGDMLLLGVKTLDLVRERTASPGGTLVAQASHSLQVIDWASGRLVKEIELSGEAVRAVAIAPNRTIVASAETGGQVRLWNVQQGQMLTSLALPGQPVALAFSTDGRWLAAADESGGVSVWQLSGVALTARAARVHDVERMITRGKYELTTAAEPFITAHDSFSLAILELDNLGVEATLARTVSNLLMARFANHPNLRLLERDAIDRVVREIRFQNTGLTTPEDAAHIGRLLNAGRVLVGSLNELGSALVLSVRIVDTETARVIGAREILCNDCNLEDLPRGVTLLVGSILETP
jgi:WD40 repeat protein/TolB-like protein